MPAPRVLAAASLLVLVACGSSPAPQSPPADAPAAAAAPAASPAPAAWVAFGAIAAEDRPVLAATALLDDPARYVGQTVRVEGRVADVCQKAGCWMVIAEGERSIRVTMKDHGFSVDRGGAGQVGQVDGVLVAKPVDPATVAHYESESGKPGLIPEKSATGGVSYELVADGVRFRPAG